MISWFGNEKISNLRHDFDRLSSRKKIRDRNASHSRHFHRIDDEHKLVHKSQWQQRIFQTVNSLNFEIKSWNLTVALQVDGDQIQFQLANRKWWNGEHLLSALSENGKKQRWDCKNAVYSFELSKPSRRAEFSHQYSLLCILAFPFVLKRTLRLLLLRDCC